MGKCQETQLKDGKLVSLKKTEKFTSKHVTIGIRQCTPLPDTGSGFPDPQVSHGDFKEASAWSEDFTGFILRFCLPLCLSLSSWPGLGLR